MVGSVTALPSSPGTEGALHRQQGNARTMQPLGEYPVVVLPGAVVAALK